MNISLWVGLTYYRKGWKERKKGWEKVSSRRSTVSLQAESRAISLFRKASTPPPVECLLFPGPENLQAAFNWPGPDPLSPTTEFEDVIVYMSAFIPARLLHWVEIRLTELDQITGQTIKEHLFHLSSTNYYKSDLYWVADKVWIWFLCLAMTGQISSD
jgi:hypothetical protein